MISLVLAMVLGSGGVFQTTIKDHFDVMVIHSYVSDEGKVSWKQLIFLDWYPEDRRFHVEHWTLFRDIDDPIYNPVTKKYVIGYLDHYEKAYRKITADSVRHKTSNTDPEKEDQESHSLSERRGLWRKRKQWPVSP